MRQSKTVTQNGVTTRTNHIWDGQNIIGDIVDGNLKTFNRGLGGQLISTRQNGNTYNFLHNGLGDIIGLVDNLGNSVENYVFCAFGVQLNKSIGRIHNPFGYNGEYTDGHTGFQYLRNRFYDPSIGRFINEDPIRWGTNWFIYADNNPIRFNDPWGLAPNERFATIEEAETIGLDHYRGGVRVNASEWRTTENALRREHGLPMRVNHGGNFQIRRR